LLIASLTRPLLIKYLAKEKVCLLGGKKCAIEIGDFSHLLFGACF